MNKVIKFYIIFLIIYIASGAILIVFTIFGGELLISALSINVIRLITGMLTGFESFLVDTIFNIRIIIPVIIFYLILKFENKIEQVF